MSRTVTSVISGWGRYPKQTCNVSRPEKYADLIPAEGPCIARGRGRSYGDAALNANHHVILTERLNRFLNFDKSKGILTAEAGISLAEILEVIVPAGFFLPVTPGTQFASLGGCVASDVHGKNHHHDGSLGKYVIALELITADKNKVLCTPQKNSDLFWATIGGMGLTGIIGSVVLKLMPIANPFMMVCHHTAQDLEQAFLYLEDNAFDDHYSVAWLDTVAQGSKFGRSIVMTAHHAKPEELPLNLHHKNKKIQRVGFDCPSWLLNKTTVGLFNNYYYRTQSKKTNSFISHYQPYFYPLDSLADWNRLYGKKGFIQYQCVLPASSAFTGIKKLLEILTKNRCPSLLAVLKRFGNGSKGILSFPQPGYTLALDIPFHNEETLHTLDALDNVVMQQNGRVYLAKDACLSPQHFRVMYPRYPEWLAIKRKVDPENIFSSSLARRLKIGEE